MLGSGVAGYLIGRPGDTVDRAPPARTATTTAPAQPTPRPSPTPVAQPTPTAPTEAFAYRRLSIDSAAAEAEACLFFNKPVAKGDTVKMADYVRISPEVKSAVRVVDDKLCIGGLAYGQDYAVTLLSGLPSADGMRLDETDAIALALAGLHQRTHPLARFGAHAARR